MDSIQLKPGKESSLQRRHPWVFSGAVASVSKGAMAGNWAEVLDHRGRRLGHGFLGSGSIAVRMLHFGDDSLETPDSLWLPGLQKALNTRQRIGYTQTPDAAFRLVHGEGDGFPGLVIDVYANHAVIQCHDEGMHLHVQNIAAALRLVLPDLKTVYEKSGQTLPGSGEEEDTDRWLFGDAGSAVVDECGVKMKVDWVTGQKTGFFLDQRVNRMNVRDMSNACSVLNTFCYSGGFSLQALAGGASQVCSVDVSRKAMDLVDHNVSLNGFPADKHRSVCADVMEFLRDEKELWDIVILDPPAFAKSLAKRHNAVQAYKRVNVLGMNRVKAGGLLYTFSCSQVVDRELFNHTITAAAIECGREVKVLAQLSQSPDHPVSIFHPEGHYLKGLLLQVF